MLALGLGLATLAVWGGVTVFDGGADVQDTHAGTSEGDGSDGELAAETTKDCVPEDEADAWRQEHSSILLADRLLAVEESGDWVCFTYTE